MSHDGDFVLLARADNPAIAARWASTLEAQGVNAYVPGKLVADQWRGTDERVGTEVFVKRAELCEARRLIETDPDYTEPRDEPDDVAAPPPPEPEPAAPHAPVPLTAQQRRAIVFEIAAVIGVTFFGWYVNAFHALLESGFTPVHQGFTSASHTVVSLLHSAALILLLRWVISTTGQPASTFGWVRLRPLMDPFVALGLLVVTYIPLPIVNAMVAPFLKIGWLDPIKSFLIGGSRPDRAVHVPVPANAWIWCLVVMEIVVSAFREELLARGYLITRLKKLGVSGWRAIVASSAIWSGMHVYEGGVSVVHAFVTGLVLGAAFLQWRRLWPLALCHSFHNVLATIAPMMLKHSGV